MSRARQPGRERGGMKLGKIGGRKGYGRPRRFFVRNGDHALLLRCILIVRRNSGACGCRMHPHVLVGGDVAEPAVATRGIPKRACGLPILLDSLAGGGVGGHGPHVDVTADMMVVAVSKRVDERNPSLWQAVGRNDATDVRKRGAEDDGTRTGDGYVGGDASHHLTGWGRRIG
ncbi:hypothetical protein FGB62_122g029 [Gracilaria domingensis]|nr:hypothetical protein FGB62_122g029 [Gracilaria domingensis]